MLLRRPERLRAAQRRWSGRDLRGAHDLRDEHHGVRDEGAEDRLVRLAGRDREAA